MENKCRHFEVQKLICLRGGMFHYFHLLCPFYGDNTGDVQESCAGFDAI